MATRTTEKTNDVTPLDILTAMYEEGDNPQEDTPVNLTAIAVAVGAENTELFNMLDKIADDTDIINGKGMDWWFTNNYPTAELMAEAYKDIAKPAPSAPKAPRKAVAKKTATKPVKPAVTPVKGSDGKNITVPVSEGSTERRELDAAQGEKLIGEDDMREIIKITPKVVPMEEFESDIDARGERLPEPKTIPPLSALAIAANVPPNFWYMAYAAATASARQWWMRKVASLIQATPAS